MELLEHADVLRNQFLLLFTVVVGDGAIDGAADAPVALRELGVDGVDGLADAFVVRNLVQVGSGS